jgi:prolipoprotein diacylglyceryltransferase
MALLMVNMQRHGIWRGNLAKFYIVCYLLYRFVTETIRPEAVYAWRLTGYQWLALVFIPIFLILWWRDARPTRLV